MDKKEASKVVDPLADIAARVEFNEEGKRRATLAVAKDRKALHQYRLAKAVYSQIVEEKEDDLEFVLENEVNQLQKEITEGHLQSKSHWSHHGEHHHIGIGHEHEDHAMHETHAERELNYGKKDDPVNKMVKSGRQIMKKEATTKKRHRISKKRFMNFIDVDLVKAAVASANLDNSLLWSDNFDVNKLSAENLIVCRRDMLKMEVIVEALKEGVLDKAFTSKNKKIPIKEEVPTEEMLQEFESAREMEKRERFENDENVALDFARKRVKELGADTAKDGDTTAAETALKEVKEMLVKMEKQRLLDGLKTEDVFSNIVKTIRPPDSPNDEWSVNESTTTGSYLSWRKQKKMKAVRGKIFKTGPKNWTDENYIWLRLIASLIIFGYWGKYLLQAMDDAFYDIFTEQLHIHNVWMIRKNKSELWQYFFIKFHDWFHFIFTFIAPLIVFNKSTSLGVIYGFSILVDAFISMFIRGHDLVYKTVDLTWETISLYATSAIFMSLLFVFFLVFHYIVDNPVKIAREFTHRKHRRLNRIIQAKCLGNFEQRMFAWDWMTHHARLRELRKLAREYPEIEKVNGHYPVPEKGEVKFDLRKELSLFRLRHCFYDVTMKGGWVNLDEYQDGLFGSGESSEDEPIDKNKNKAKWRSQAYVTKQGGYHNVHADNDENQKRRNTLTEESADISKARGTLGSQLTGNEQGLSLKSQKRDSINSRKSEVSEGLGSLNAEEAMTRESFDTKLQLRKTLLIEFQDKDKDYQAYHRDRDQKEGS